jgi:hypothetical protein
MMIGQDSRWTIWQAGYNETTNSEPWEGTELDVSWEREREREKREREGRERGEREKRKRRLTVIHDAPLESSSSGEQRAAADSSSSSNVAVKKGTVHHLCWVAASAYT